VNLGFRLGIPVLFYAANQGEKTSWAKMGRIPSLPDLLPKALENHRNLPLINSALIFLREQQIVAPGMSTIERLVCASRQFFREKPRYRRISQADPCSMRKKQHKDIFEAGILLGQDSLAGSQLTRSDVQPPYFYAQNALLIVGIFAYRPKKVHFRFFEATEPTILVHDTSKNRLFQGRF
jgi:hypothetical protein